RVDVAVMFPASVDSIEQAVAKASYVQWNFPANGWAIE
ncbi:hypothetical protein KIPB_012007, partial [Kipferlia bialata]